MKKLILIIPVLFFSCVEKGAAIEMNQHGAFQVEFLFEKDGCKMYRFLDGGRYVYWCNCEGKVNADYTSRHGKTHTNHYEETITTKH